MKLKGSNTEATTTPTTSYLRRFFCKVLHKKPNKPSLQPHSAPSSNEASTSPARVVEFHRVFLYFDENGDGKISPSELRNCVRTFGHELSAEDVEAVVESTDSDGDGLLGFEDFVKLVEVEGKEEKRKNLKDAFRVYITDGQDCITPRSLREALRRLGDSKSIDECNVMIRRFDLDGDGVLSFDEFRVMML